MIKFFKQLIVFVAQIGPLDSSTELHKAVTSCLEAYAVSLQINNELSKFLDLWIT